MSGLTNKKFIVNMSKSSIRIDEDELVKVMDALQKGEVKVLRQGWFNPSFFVSVVPDEEWMNNYLTENRHQLREGKIDGYPQYPDLFLEVRASINLLSDKKSIHGHN